MAVILGKTCQFLKEIQTILARFKFVRKREDDDVIELIGEFEATISKFEEYLASWSLSVEDQCDGISLNNPPISLSLQNKTANTNANEPTTQPTSNDNWSDASIPVQDCDVNFSPLEDLPLPRNVLSSGHNEDWAAAVLTAAVGEADPCPNPIMLVTNEASVVDDRVVLQGDREGHDQVAMQGDPDGDDRAILPSGCEGLDQVLLQEYLPTESALEAVFAANDKDDRQPDTESIDPNRGVVIERDRDRIELKTRCSICLKRFDRDCRLRQHMFIKHEGGVLDKQVCPFCGKSFESKYLKSHISATHEGKEMICNVCRKTFATISGLNAHRKNVHGGRRFACHNCNKSFASKWGLEVHFGKEHEIRSFACELCESVFKSSNLLRRHMQGVHERIRHSCSNCSASFTQKSQLTYHVKLKHHFGREDCRLVCEKCKKVFVVPFKMREHRKKCMAVLESNAGYAHIAASLAERNELPEKT